MYDLSLCDTGQFGKGLYMTLMVVTLAYLYRAAYLVWMKRKSRFLRLPSAFRQNMTCRIYEATF
jgi:hypothetical protein